MVIRELLKKADIILSNKGIDDSFNEAAVLFAFAADRSKTYIFTHMDEEADAETVKRFDDYVNKRSQRTPVAYITGSAWFMFMELKVNSATLIPRPETEELAEETIRRIKELPQDRIDVLDLCTGSGCIGLAAAYYDNRVNAVLCDLNPVCVKTAAENSSELDLAERIETLKGDLFEPVEGRLFDVITINPPYIPTGDVAGLMKDVRDFEPGLALDGGTDGLDFYRKTAKSAPAHLKKGGFLVLEIGIGQSEDIVQLLKESNFKDISIKMDISGIPRIIIAFI